MDFSAAVAPAVSGSKFTITRLVNRPSSRTCVSVNAVPLIASTLRIPAIYTEMQSICPSTSTAKSLLRISPFALSRLNSTLPLVYSTVSGELRYFAFLSSGSSARAVNAITFPASFAMGNVIRLRKRA